MSDQLQSELRAYMSYLDTHVAPMSIDEMNEQRFGSESVRPIGLGAQQVDARPRRGWLVVVTSAAAVLLVIGGAAWLTRSTGSDSPAADTIVPTTLATTEIAPESEGVAVSVTGHLLDSHYWEAPAHGLDTVAEGRMDLSDERISGDVTFTYNGEVFEPPGLALYSGTMLIKNDGGTWVGTHFAADHHARPDAHGPLVMQLSGSGDYEGLSAILYRTVISPPGTALRDLEESVDGMIFPGDLPADRN